MLGHNNKLCIIFCIEPFFRALNDSWINEFFFVRANDKPLDLQIKSKKLSGEGDNTALGVLFEYELHSLSSLEVKNAVFTDLFFDQSNIVYVHVNGDNKSLMLNKSTTTHKLTF